jgi:alkylation response protein AidB-like acyl-CoA dehydrogenase
MTGPNADELSALGDSIADVLGAECDRRKLHAFVDGKHDLEAVLNERARELGWFAIGLAEEQGGLGLGPRGLAVLHRELGRHCAPGAFISTLSAAQALADAKAGGQYLERIAAGDLAVCVPAAPVQAGKAFALEKGKVSGRMTEVLGSAKAGLALIPVTEGSRTAWALVDLGANARLAQRKTWDATRALFDLECQGAAAEAVAGDAAALANTLAMHMGLAVAFDCVGASDGIFNQTLDYMKGRVQFEKSIASFQGLKHRASRLKIEAELARHAAAQALRAVELGETDRQTIVALSKATVTESFAFIAADCVQLHGGVGHTWEFDCHLFLKRARLNEALVGSNDQQLDWAEAQMAEAARAGRSVLELPL